MRFDCGARARLAAGLGFLFLASTASAQISLVEVAEARSIVNYKMTAGMGGGLAAADFDADGDIDVFVPTDPSRPAQLYRNLGNGQFENIAASVGLDVVGRYRAALWFDYDGDHRLDLAVAGDCLNRDDTCGDLESSVRLFRQTAGGSFVDVTAEAGVADTEHTSAMHRGGLAAGDVNGDGFLDLVTTMWKGRLRLFLNQGDGTFEEASVETGLGATWAYHQMLLLDWNGDGLLDIYAAVDFDPNLLYLNQGSPNGPGGVPWFTEVAEALHCDNDMNDMGVTAGDLDDDGDPDLYISNIYTGAKYNVLLTNDGADFGWSCTDLSDPAGVRDGGWGWGVSFFDVDNDTDLDLIETNGWLKLREEYVQPPRLFVNQGDGTFVNRAPEVGLTDTRRASSIVAFDFDRDGDLDLMETHSPSPLSLYENQLQAGVPDRHYLVVRPRMAGPNHWAIGATVSVELPGQTQTRWILAGTSYLGQEPAEAFFGLGTAGATDRITVRWPDGQASTYGDVPADQVLDAEDAVVFASGFESGAASSWNSVKIK